MDDRFARRKLLSVATVVLRFDAEQAVTAPAVE
jgi:hypothetical protein